MSSIVVGVDGSEPAARALRQWADELLRGAKKGTPTDVNDDEEVRDGQPTEAINDIAHTARKSVLVVPLTRGGHPPACRACPLGGAHSGASALRVG